MRYLLSLFAACGLLFSACKDLSPAEQLEKDIKKIQEYLSENSLTANSTDSGLHYIITQEGTGGHPNLQSNVTVKYKGYLLDGTVFDQTTGNQTATFPLANLISGWQECIPLLKKGGKGTFFLPSALGYGPSGSGSIPANAPLIFEIELVNFN